MLRKPSHLAVIGAIVLAIAFSCVPRPARADDTTSLLLGAAVGVAGTILYENMLHRQQAATQVVGYTANGCAIYADGHTGCASSAAGVPPTVSCVGANCAGPASYGRYGGNAAQNGGYYGRRAAQTRYGRY